MISAEDLRKLAEKVERRAFFAAYSPDELAAALRAGAAAMRERDELRQENDVLRDARLADENLALWKQHALRAERERDELRAMIQSHDAKLLLESHGIRAHDALLEAYRRTAEKLLAAEAERDRLKEESEAKGELWVRMSKELAKEHRTREAGESRLRALEAVAEAARAHLHAEGMDDPATDFSEWSLGMLDLREALASLPPTTPEPSHD